MKELAGFKRDLLLILLIAIFFVQCDSEENEMPEDKNEEIRNEILFGARIVSGDSLELLNMLHEGGSKTWKTDGFIIEGRTDILKCRLDDQLTLNSNGTYAYDRGDLSCFAGEPQKMDGQWYLSSSDRKLVFDSLYVIDLSSLESNRVILEAVYDGGFLGKYDIAGLFSTNSSL